MQLPTTEPPSEWQCRGHSAEAGLPILPRRWPRGEAGEARARLCHHPWQNNTSEMLCGDKTRRVLRGRTNRLGRRYYLSVGPPEYEPNQPLQERLYAVAHDFDGSSDEAVRASAAHRPL